MRSCATSEPPSAPCVFNYIPVGWGESVSSAGTVAGVSPPLPPSILRLGMRPVGQPSQVHRDKWSTLGTPRERWVRGGKVRAN